jgi:hypothetical protein
VIQVDCALISNRLKNAIRDIRALRGPDIGSDQNLLKINCKVKLRVKNENKYSEKRKIMNIFQNSKWIQEYTTEFNIRLKILENMKLKSKRVFFYFFVLFYFIIKK